MRLKNLAAIGLLAIGIFTPRSSQAAKVQHSRKPAKISYDEALKKASAMHLRLGHLVSRGGNYRVVKIIANAKVTAYCPYHCRTCGTSGVLAFPKAGNIHKTGFAADPKYYPPGSRIICLTENARLEGPIDDRGGSIKGPERFDARYQRHRDAIKFGRPKRVVIVILAPTRSPR